MVLPGKLKEDCLNQLERSLFNIKSSSFLSLSLIKKVNMGHISTSLLINSLNECDDIEFSIVPLMEKDVLEILSNSEIITISNDGNTFLLSKCENDYKISSYENGNVIFCYNDSLSNLKDDFKLAGFSIAIKLKEKLCRNSSSYLFTHFTNQKASIYSIISSSVCIALLGVATPLAFQTFTDKILPYQATSSLYVLATILILAALATSVFSCYHDFQENVLLAKYQNGLGKEVFRRLLAMDIPYFDRNNVGELTKLVEQVGEASNFLVHQALSSVVSVISLLVVLPILFVYSVQLTAIVLGIGLLMAVTVGFALRPIRNRVMQAYSYDANFQSTLIEMLKGIKTIKSLANESHFRNKANTALETNLYGSFNVARLSNVIGALVNFQSQLITVAVIFFGAQAVFNNQMSIGQLIAFNMLANNVVNPLVSLVMTASGWENFKLAQRKLNELVPPKPPILQLGSQELDLNGDIEFENVWFKYPNSDEDAGYVLEGVSFKINQGEIIGVVGSSGSGKSTLASLLLGFYKPSKGKITINGYDIGFISPEVLRARISSVQQTSFLFNTSVMENVHLGRLNSSLDDVQGALQDSGASEFVDEMPHKFFTELTEDGGNLSGGQRQRLAIARALVRKSDILLFDEATSALDNQTEDKIKVTIHQACQQKTAIIIAHRLNTLSYCDRLIVMHQGKVEIIGTHEQLLQSDNSYRKMWASHSRETQTNVESLPRLPASTALLAAAPESVAAEPLNAQVIKGAVHEV